MNRKLAIIHTFVLALMLLVCGCGGVEQEKFAREDENVLAWEEITDIFDPMGYAEQGYFEMQQEKLLESRRDLMVVPYEWMKYNALEVKQQLEWEGIWTDVANGIEYRETFRFENEKLSRIHYEYRFYDAEEGKQLFLKLCERMQEITDEPEWFGMRNLKEGETSEPPYIPPRIQDIEMYLDDEDYAYFEYCIDMRNPWEVYTSTDNFDPDSIKSDARWIADLGEV